MLSRIHVTVVVLLTLCGGCFAAQTTFADLHDTEHLYGAEVTPEDLVGKVVFLEYWGVRCPPCRDSFPRLIQLQQQFAHTGKFTILASHRQQDKEGAKNFCEEKKVNFPVVQGYNNKEAPCPNGLPSAVLIDHTGTIVAQDHPIRLYKKVAALVEAAPEPTPPILGDVELKYCKSQARRLASGKAIANTLKSLDKYAEGDGDKAKEAAALAAAARAYIAGEKTKRLALVEQTPAAALVALEELAKQVKGLPEEADVEAALDTLKNDRDTTKLADLIEDWHDLTEELIKKGRDQKLVKKQESLKQKVENYLKKIESPVLKAEAEAILKQL